MPFLLIFTLLGGFILTGLVIVLLMLVHMLYMWLFVLVLLGGILLTGIFVDFVSKKKEFQTDPKEGSKHLSESQRIYTENGMNDYKNEINNGGPNNF